MSAINLMHLLNVSAFCNAEYPMYDHLQGL